MIYMDKVVYHQQSLRIHQRKHGPHLFIVGYFESLPDDFQGSLRFLEEQLLARLNQEKAVVIHERWFGSEEYLNLVKTAWAKADQPTQLHACVTAIDGKPCYSGNGKSCNGFSGIQIEAVMTGGDLYEIVPEVAYGSENNSYYDETTRAYKEQYNTGGEQRPAIKGTLDGASKYDVVFLGSPIWYGKSPRVILTFLDKYGFEGKTVIPFVTSAASGITKVNEELPATYPNINWKEGRRLNGISDADLRTWVENFVSSTTAINETINRQSTRSNNIYSLDGRLLSKAQDISSLKRGIYIINGKKTIIQ